jgi:hypothetical protein
MKNKMVTNEPITNPVATMFFLQEVLFFPNAQGKFEIDGYLSSEKENQLFKNNVKIFGLLSFTSMQNKFNATI